MAEERNPGEPEEQVEDLDVPQDESEDVKGGAFDVFNKDNVAGFKQGIRGNKLQPGNLGGLNFGKH